MVSSQLPPPPKSPAAPSPIRPHGSIRRTSSIDVDWPEGRLGAMRFHGRARDYITPGDARAAYTCTEDTFEATVAPDRTILGITAHPGRAHVNQLVGARGGGHLRGVLDEALPEERRDGTPLNLLLDDISGTSLIAGWAWSQWGPEWLEELRRVKADPEFAAKYKLVNICTGLREGSSGHNLLSEGAPSDDLRHPDDPHGWHELIEKKGASMRRARRIDVAFDGEAIVIDAAFQDSASTPQGVRSALHEYRISAAADADLRLTRLKAEPRVLPFAECPAAAGNVARLLGVSLRELRTTVLAELRGTAGCTHLNDALRALADVPILAERLREALPKV